MRSAIILSRETQRTGVRVRPTPVFVILLANTGEPTHNGRCRVRTALHPTVDQGDAIRAGLQDRADRRLHRVVRGIPADLDQRPWRQDGDFIRANTSSAATERQRP